MLKSWIILLLSICAEVSGTTCLKFSDGFTRLLPSLGVAIGYGLSFWGLSLVLRHMEMGMAYAVWSGVGTALVALIGIVFLGEQVGLLKMMSIGLIVAGVIGLNLSSGVH
ncbi:DMT family transporter [Pseudodesulfovibrio tunisiensis]|uniref:DMT family transporter n=1 Tax=Pseudodesulfovibrio tunisiensis TaxID=463192 RepID=UPI001FB39E04|nr:multidrug efflux SMR transporter [Pseudodesulfovibrio tunisiensis]